MLKIRLMGTKNDIKWFKKILERHPKVEVTEFSDYFSNIGKDIVSEVKEVYGKSIPVFPIEIPLSVRAAETSAVAKSIYDYDPKGKAAIAYMTLTKEVLAHGC